MNMTIVIIDFELENYKCTRFLDENDFKKWLSFLDDEIYFVDVSDKTWKKFKMKKSRRLELTLDELNELLDKTLYLFIIKQNYIESCMYYPKND
jgi:3-phenylpropionate/cinnamic acid dioxygenase small subunit